MSLNGKRRGSGREVAYVGAITSLVALLVVAVYAVIGAFGPDVFSYKVVTGALLGSAVTFVNFVILAVSVERAFDNALAERGSGEMSEEETADFVKKNTAKVQLAVARSTALRMALMVAALVAAFLTRKFDVIATVIPILAYRPIISAAKFAAGKKIKTEGGER